MKMRIRLSGVAPSFEPMGLRIYYCIFCFCQIAVGPNVPHIDFWTVIKLLALSSTTFL